MKYRVEVTSAEGNKIVTPGLDRTQVRDKIDSILFTTHSRIESIYVRFVDSTKVVVIEE